MYNNNAIRSFSKNNSTCNRIFFYARIYWFFATYGIFIPEKEGRRDKEEEEEEEKDLMDTC